MSQGVSLVRLYLLRAVYLMNFVVLGLQVWPALIGHEGAWDPVQAVAYSFWAALSVLSGLGLRYPLKMLPLLLLQLVYKLIWLAAVALPTWPAVRGLEITTAMIVGFVIDLIVIPWGFLFATVTEHGDRWRREPQVAAIQTPGHA